MIGPLRSFLRRNDGAATVETVLWFPFLMAVFGLMIDVAMVFHGQAKVLNVVQEGNREFSIGRITTTDATETYIEGRLSQLNISGTASTSTLAGVAYTVVDVPVNQLQILGYFSVFSSLEIQVYTEHMIENWEV